MNRRRIALGFLFFSLLSSFSLFRAAPAFATSFLLFQHGGRTTGQAGAFVARASDPSAVRFNPAALTRLDGFQFQAGLDFQAPKDEFASSGQVDLPQHVIQFPPSLYASWRPDDSTLAYGLSIDAPLWSILDWNTVLFPGRFDTLRQELILFELRPSVAWAIDERWSLGGSLRYVRGDLETSWATLETFSAGPGLSEPAEIHSEAATTVDGLGFDLALHYAADSWGAGVVASSGVSLDGDGDIHHFPLDPFFNPGAEDDFAERFPSGSAGMDFELPPTLTAGFFWSATDSLDIEVDVAWSGWSKLDRTRIDLDEHPWTSEPPALDRRRDWEDVIAIRLGAERNFAGGWAAGAGLAWEPSPVPDSTLEPGFPRGDAYAVALGGSYNMDGLSFDLGYSYFLYEDRDGLVRGGPPTAGLVPVTGTYSARSQVFSVSARWRR